MKNHDEKLIEVDIDIEHIVEYTSEEEVYVDILGLSKDGRSVD